MSDQISDAFLRLILAAFWTSIGGIVWLLDASPFWLGFVFAYFLMNIVRYLAACYMER